MYTVFFCVVSAFLLSVVLVVLKEATNVRSAYTRMVWCE